MSKNKSFEHFQLLRNRKAQLKMGENIAIIFIFILLIVFGLVFFSRIQGAGIKVKQAENIELAAIQIAQKVSFIPELRCSSENVPVPDCYDSLKMQYIKEVIEEDPSYESYYYDLFKFSTIWVEEIFPEQKIWVIYNNTGDKDSRSVTQIPISIYDPLTSSLGSYYFGVLYVGVWS